MVRLRILHGSSYACGVQNPTFVVGVNDPKHISPSMLNTIKYIPEGGDVYVSTPSGYSKFVRSQDGLYPSKAASTLSKDSILAELNAVVDNINNGNTATFDLEF